MNAPQGRIPCAIFINSGFLSSFIFGRPVTEENQRHSSAGKGHEHRGELADVKHFMIVNYVEMIDVIDCSSKAGNFALTGFLYWICTSLGHVSLGII